MWASIRNQLAATLQRDIHFDAPLPLSQDETERKYRLNSTIGPLFIKLQPRTCCEQFACEQRDLQRLAQYEQIMAPWPLLCGVANNVSFLLLPYHDLIDGTPEQWFQMGCDLACLHRCSEQEMYGWDEDNFIGRTLQPNRWQKQWANFFAEERIGWQLSLLKEKGRLAAHWNIDEIIEITHRILRQHEPSPSLLHGDLWRGNTGFTEEGSMVFDPACYFGDRETDIAMTELFGGFPTAFYQGYESVWPLERTYHKRRDLYNLYHKLNHLNLFGDGFQLQVEQGLARLLAS
ncbi:MAG: fructosamine kinase family protein [Aeromonadaceae bacterium]